MVQITKEQKYPENKLQTLFFCLLILLPGGNRCYQFLMYHSNSSLYVSKQTYIFFFFFLFFPFSLSPFLPFPFSFFSILHTLACNGYGLMSLRDTIFCTSFLLLSTLHCHMLAYPQEISPVIVALQFKVGDCGKLVETLGFFGSNFRG